jgi:hypothetical protein
MSSWKASMRLLAEGELMEKEHKEIQHEIFHDDSLSPLLSCTSFIPLIEQLNKLDTGCETHIKDKSVKLTFTWMTRI